MTNILSIQNLSIVTHNNTPVITTELLAQLYGTEVIRIQQNHVRNNERFIEGKHYYKLESIELKEFKNRLSLSELVNKHTRSLILWTERGAARHAKMLETDQAWEIFEKLEDFYFNQKEDRKGHITPNLPRPKRKVIKSRDDLSFTKRNEHGHLINWNVPNRVNSWHEAYGIGEMWFDEIVELARNNPKEALDAMMYAVPALAQNYRGGHSEGFYDQMARWALTGMLEHKGDLSLPFKTLDMGIEPKEGFNHYLNQI